MSTRWRNVFSREQTLPVLRSQTYRERHDLVMPLSACDEIAMPKTKTKAASANIHAVLGSDESEVKRVAAELASNLTPPSAGDCEWESVDGAADNADQAAARVRSAIEAVQTLPFFGDTKVVWL